MSRRLRFAIAFAVLALSIGVASPAAAFCGYFVGPTEKLYNDATQVVLMRHGTKTVVSMRPDYTGPIEDFAMVVPVPEVLSEKDVLTLKRGPLDTIDRLSAPRLVEYYEADPCSSPYLGKKDGIDTLLDRMDDGSGGGAAPRVRVMSSFQRDEYSIVILDANDSTALEKWLTRNGYKQPPGAAAALAPYVQEGFYFFAAKVDAKKVQFAPGGKAALSPLQFRYSSDKFQLPIRLGLINAKGKQDLIIFVLAHDRFEVANRKNLFIPTNMDVSEARKKDFASWYDDHFSAQLANQPAAVVTEYAWPVNVTCDPCPDGMSRLSDSELVELGGELLGPNADVRNMVLTRLHTRYDAKGGSSDLMFQKASPVQGGREVVVDGKLEQGAKRSATNNFQARYAIRHPWTGKVACENPRRGRWTSSVSATPFWGPVTPSASPTAKRALSRTDVKSTVNRYRSRIANCAKTQNKAGFKGVVKVKFYIKPNGRTRDSTVASPALKDTDLGECIRKVTTSMTFPKTAAGKDVPVVYPFQVE